MEKTQRLISMVRPWVLYFGPFFLLFFAATFMSYWPALQGAADDLYDIYLREAFFNALLVNAIITVLFSGVVFIFVYFRYTTTQQKPPWIWTYMLYAFILLFYSWQFLIDLTDDLSRSGGSFYAAFSDLPIDPVLYELGRLRDARYFFLIITVGLILLLLYKPLYNHFCAVFIPNNYMQKASFLSETDQEDTLKSESKNQEESMDDFVDRAEKMANTFADPVLNEKVASVEIDFFSFVYGEGFDYVIINEGYTVPYLMDDEEEIDDMYGGIFIHVNKNLYIRFDHIVMVDMNELYVMISPELEGIYQKVNNKRVKEKIASYRYKPNSPTLFKIHPQLVAKLEQKLNRRSKR
ncbi:hypothetical protein ORI89_13225 [Sphingobacterium sp. UT-1RO-CII-1]|uniref:hypothetical protein n=1 Tax=Sphingobacterium sp. UT-1RO-CII-1 TaxID=2995225 RepID=UPI00227C3F9F|nr:hypothetical protein [Sphingobacterium sp. UT-1RO-CII-1]MCY4780615.1 hypothetical protein [Sphingobacterium sp. UT-1RO-CII-1]